MDEKDNQLFEDMVIRELDACGYFMNLEYAKTRTMPEMIMDFACLYCMENYNKKYRYTEEKNEN